MDFILNLVDIVLHLDEHLTVLIQSYGTFTYAILFLIIFAETGLVITPFLPGDSLLFAIGALSSLGALDIFLVWILLCIAAILGDTVNYWVGYFIGPKVFERNIRFLNKKHLDRTHQFYEKHGAKVIILARFIPIIRTFAPFVAGVGKMNYLKFLTYNVVGGVLWISLFTFAGYYFGNIPMIKENFSYVVIAIIFISLIPILIDVLKNLKSKKVE